MINTILSKNIEFHLPEKLQCALPTEKRGIKRDEVRLLISNKNNNKIAHSIFHKIGDYLKQGDILLVNTSATMPAALDITMSNGSPGRLHLSTMIEENKWVVEIREIKNNSTKRFYDIGPENVFNFSTGGYVEINKPFYENNKSENHLHLWEADFYLPISVKKYLLKYGLPIKYNQINKKYPLPYYQSIFSNNMGSAEMPSAGRAFTPELVAKLIVKGVQFAPILLHTGVSSLENDEQPYPEYYKVTPTTASLVNLAKKENRRVIAVGTTAVRAIEAATKKNGKIKAAEGWTDLYITPEKGLKTASGLLTGFHEPKASHLLMLGALTGKEHIIKGYEAALRGGYEWHEFGDLHLIV